MSGSSKNKVQQRCFYLRFCKATKTNKQTNFINKHIILQKHWPKLARLFEVGESVQNIKLRLGPTKESLWFTKKWNKNRNMDED